MRSLKGGAKRGGRHGWGGALWGAVLLLQAAALFLFFNEPGRYRHGYLSTTWPEGVFYLAGLAASIGFTCFGQPARGELKAWQRNKGLCAVFFQAQIVMEGVCRFPMILPQALFFPFFSGCYALLPHWRARKKRRRRGMASLLIGAYALLILSAAALQILVLYQFMQRLPESFPAILYAGFIGSPLLAGLLEILNALLANRPRRRERQTASAPGDS